MRPLLKLIIPAARRVPLALPVLFDVEFRYLEVWNSRPEKISSISEIEEWGKSAWDEVFKPGMT